MLPSEPKPATAEARALLRVAEGDRKTVELFRLVINSPYTELRTWRAAVNAGKAKEITNGN